MLVWTGELIRDIVATGCSRSASLMIQKLCEAVGIDCAWTEYDGLDMGERQTWLDLFVEALMDYVMTVAE